MKGTLSEGALPALLRAMYVGRKTGTLHFTRGADVRSVRFRQGHILSAQSSVPQEHLGEVLVRNELLTAADLERAGARKRATGKRLGETLQEMGLIEKEHLEDALALHVREVLLSVFSWNSGEYALEEPEGAAYQGEPTLKLSTGEMILETVRLLQNPEVVRAALGSMDRVLDLSTDPLLRFQKVTLSPTDGYVLSRVDGMMRAREIVEMIPLPQQEVEKSLYGLLCTGIIEFAPTATRAEPRRAATGGAPAPTARAAAAPSAGPDAKPKDDGAKSKEIEARRKEILDAYDGLAAKNHFEVLGLPRASSEAQVKDAYFHLARRFHPDTHHDHALVDLGPKLEAVFIRLGQAYEVLRNPRSRSSYESDLAARAPRVPRPSGDPGTPAAGTPPMAPAPPPPPPPQMNTDLEKRRAFEAMAAAEKHIEQGKFWDAIQLLEHAVQWLDGKNLTRARIALGRSYAKNPNWSKQAETILKAAIADTPKSAEAHAVLGELYAAQGLRGRAASAFRRALELDPARQDAAAALAALGPEDAPPSQPSDDVGFLKKLFGEALMRVGAVLATTLALTASLAGAADVLYLRDGDRISGRIVSEMRRTVRIDTPYGTLVVPRTAIDRIEREAKPEQAAAPAPSVAPPAVRPARGARLVLVVLGKTFWQAWDPKDAPPDRTLRIEVRVDEDPVVSFLDGTEDPDEIPKAIVNAFSFAAADVAIKPAPNVEITPPEVRPGRIVLRMSLPVARVGERRVRVAYQSNVGTVEEPSWRDLIETSVDVQLSASTPTIVQLRQDPGRMEFSGFPRRRMKHVETFVLDPGVE